MKFYINQERLDDAKKLLAKASNDNVRNSYLRTLFAKAEENNEAFANLAKKTFEQAQLAGINSLSLDVALLICSTPNTKLDDELYAEFIRENATTDWRRNNQSKLVAINL